MSAEANKKLVQQVYTDSANRNGTTFVDIQEEGFAGDPDEIVKQVLDSSQGFTLVLAGAKALLEHGIRLNLVADRYPDGHGRG